MELSERYLNDQREAGLALRTNHAVACAAASLFAGQAALAGWRARSERPAIAAARQRERERARVYAAQLSQRGVPPSRLRWPAMAAAWMLGLSTALAGARSVAHARRQVDRLGRNELERQLEGLRGRDHAATELIGQLLAERVDAVAVSSPPSRPPGLWLRAVAWSMRIGVTLLRRGG